MSVGIRFTFHSESFIMGLMEKGLIESKLLIKNWVNIAGGDLKDCFASPN